MYQLDCAFVSPGPVTDWDAPSASGSSGPWANVILCMRFSNPLPQGLTAQPSLQLSPLLCVPRSVFLCIRLIYLSIFLIARQWQGLWAKSECLSKCLLANLHHILIRMLHASCHQLAACCRIYCTEGMLWHPVTLLSASTGACRGVYLCCRHLQGGDLLCLFHAAFQLEAQAHIYQQCGSAGGLCLHHDSSTHIHLHPQGATSLLVHRADTTHCVCQESVAVEADRDRAESSQSA